LARGRRAAKLESGNPEIIKASYFQSLDMTIFVNEPKGEVSHWRTGRETE